MSIALVVQTVVMTLVLLFLGLTCLVQPRTVQRLALDRSHRWGRGHPMRMWLLTKDFIWVVRLCGGIFLFYAVLLVFTLV